MKVSILIVSALAAADAFIAPSINRASIVPHTSTDLNKMVRFSTSNDDNLQNDEFDLETPSTNTPKKFDPIPALTAAIITFSSNAAYADSPDWGIFEGKTGSLLHPVTMFSMLALSVSTALLGFEWRRQVRLLSIFCTKYQFAVFRFRLTSVYKIDHSSSAHNR